jgi:periplasmic protein TonB
METLKSVKADLENKKIIFREIGLIIALLLVFLAFSIKTPDKQNAGINFNGKSTVSEEMIPVTVQEVTPPPVAPPPQYVTRINIVENDVEADENIVIDAEADQETVVEEYLPNLPQEEDEVIAEETIFVVVESMPTFPGGYAALSQYLHENISYPIHARELNIQGKVFLTFVVEKDGSVTDVELLRGIGGGCDEEAIKVVQHMPKWNPGKQRNVPVRVKYNLPVNFKLE